MRFYLSKTMMILTLSLFVLAASQTCPAADDKEAGKGDSAKPSGYVAVVNGVKIPKVDFDRKMELIEARYASMGMPVKGERLAQLREMVLDNLIEKQLLYQESEARGIEVEPEQVKKELDQLKGRFEDEAAFQKKIAAMNYTEEILKDQIRENLAIRKLIDQEIASKVSVSDQEIESYYKENKKEFEIPEQVRARHILIKAKPDAGEAEKEKAKEKIKEVQKKLEQGEKFSELAEQYSEGPSAKAGGDLGYFRHGQMVEPFDKAAFALEPGQVSDIVETRFGYHLIKLEDKKPAGQESIDEVREGIRQKIRQEKIMKELKPFIESLKRKYPVEKNLPQDGQG